MDILLRGLGFNAISLILLTLVAYIEVWIAVWLVLHPFLQYAALLLWCCFRCVLRSRVAFVLCCVVLCLVCAVRPVGSCVCF